MRRVGRSTPQSSGQRNKRAPCYRHDDLDTIRKDSIDQPIRRLDDFADHLVQGFPGEEQSITPGGYAIIRDLTTTDNSDFCIYPIGTTTYQVGAYPAGSYTLQVDFLYDAFPFGPSIITLGVVPFTVTGAPAAVPAPTNSPLALLALIFAVVSVSVWVLRGRRSAWQKKGSGSNGTYLSLSSPRN